MFFVEVFGDQSPESFSEMAVKIIGSPWLKIIDESLVENDAVDEVEVETVAETRRRMVLERPWYIARGKVFIFLNVILIHSNNIMCRL